MNNRVRHSAVCAVLMTGVVVLMLIAPRLAAQSSSYTPRVTPEATGCSSEQRREALRTMQAQVLQAAPMELISMARAIEPGGPLAGWNLSHGYVVLATAGAVAVDNMKAQDPLPQLLLYAPSPSSSPSDWLDFEGPDDPYRLVGWAYVAPYTPGSQPPQRPCLAPVEWLVHEAGWHLKDGGMQVTPGATSEPPRPPSLAVHMWHPQVWDIHIWREDAAVPAIAFANPHRPGGGRELPEDAFFYVVDGHKRTPGTERAR